MKQIHTIPQCRRHVLGRLKVCLNQNYFFDAQIPLNNNRKYNRHMNVCELTSRFSGSHRCLCSIHFSNNSNFSSAIRFLSLSERMV